MDCFGKYYYLDGLICSAGNEAVVPRGEAAFYEIIRTFAGIPLFFNDHMKRMKEGIATRYPIPEGLTEEIIKGIASLTECELIPEINIRVLVTFSEGNHSLHICYVPSFYPSEKMYEEGVKLILYNAERPEPGVKLLNSELKDRVNVELSRQNAYEALLVNSRGIITEGSRSNIFFFTGDDVIYTAPDDMVLQGITRKYIIGLCQKEGIRMIFEPVRAKEITRFPAAFITGTSPMVMPVKVIDNVRFTVRNSLILKLRRLFSEVAEQSIRNFLTERKED